MVLGEGVNGEERVSELEMRMDRPKPGWPFSAFDNEIGPIGSENP